MGLPDRHTPSQEGEVQKGLKNNNGLIPYWHIYLEKVHLSTSNMVFWICYSASQTRADKISNHRKTYGW